MVTEWFTVAFILALAGILAGQPLAVVVAAVVAIAGLLRRYWAAASLRALSYRRQIQPNRAFPGEWLQVTVQMENDKLLPVVGLFVADQGPVEARWERGRVIERQHLRRQELLQQLSLGWFQRVTRHYRVQLPGRGRYEFGPARVSAGDPFGLAELEVDVPDRNEVVIFPRLTEPGRLVELLRRPGTDRAARRTMWPDPARLCGVRDYRSGDPLRSIHWLATARTGQLQVKVFDPAVSPGTAIFLNLQSLAHTWEDYHRQRTEAAISLAASLFQAELQAGRRVGLFGNGHMVGWGAGPRQPLTSGAEHWPGVLEGLGRLLPYASAPLLSVWRSEVPRLPQGTGLVLITSVSSPELSAELTRVQSLGYPVQVLWLGDGAGAAAAGDPPPGVVWHPVDWPALVAEVG